MTGILLCCAALIVLLAALYVVVCREDLAVKAWNAGKQFVGWMREPADVRSPYTLAPDPVDEHFKQTPGSIYVKSDHPEDCAKACCWEIRLTEMHDRFDWHAYEHEMGKTK